MIPKYAVLEARDKDGVCPLMIVDGKYEGVVFEIGNVGITEEGVLSYNYNVLNGEVDESFSTVVGDMIVEMVAEQVKDDDRD